MDEQDIIREICVLIPLRCLKCKIAIRHDRIDLRGGTEKTWLVQGLCSTCGQGQPLEVNLEHPTVQRAIADVCGDRSIVEEVRLRKSGDIPTNYEGERPDILGRFWQAGPKDDPHPPPPALV